MVLVLVLLFEGEVKEERAVWRRRFARYVLGKGLLVWWLWWWLGMRDVPGTYCVKGEVDAGFVDHFVSPCWVLLSVGSSSRLPDRVGDSVASSRCPLRTRSTVSYPSSKYSDVGNLQVK